MKSVYELAMERLDKSSPAEKPLTPEKKARLADVDTLFKGKIAEREIFLKQQLNQAYASQNAEDVEKIQKQIVSERTRLEEEREAEKERVRRSR